MGLAHSNLARKPASPAARAPAPELGLTAGPCAALLSLLLIVQFRLAGSLFAC